MRAMNFIPVLSLCVLLICSIEAHAQPLCDRTPAIETMVINSDYVWIARVAQVQPKQAGDERVGHDVVVTMEERLKDALFADEPAEKMSVYLPYQATVLEGWQERSSRVLIGLTMYDWEQTIAIELAPETLEVMTAEVKLIRDPEAVIQAARAAVHRLPANVKRVHTFDLIVPLEVAAGTRWEESYRTGGHLILSVPVDQHLEQRAQKLIRAGDPLRRSEVIWALAYFPSDENTALVKPLLDDPYFSFYSRDNSTSGERYYPCRYAAYQTLKAWGVAVEPPVFREEVK